MPCNVQCTPRCQEEARGKPSPALPREEEGGTRSCSLPAPNCVAVVLQSFWSPLRGCGSSCSSPWINGERRAAQCSQPHKGAQKGTASPPTLPFTLSLLPWSKQTLVFSKRWVGGKKTHQNNPPYSNPVFFPQRAIKTAPLLMRRKPNLEEVQHPNIGLNTPHS